jgi:hypothetical protein
MIAVSLVRRLLAATFGTSIIALAGCQTILGIPDWKHDETSDCSTGTCVCKADLGNCDGDSSNGCETSLTSAENCGKCGHACFGGECVSGRCQAYSLFTCPDGASSLKFAITVDYLYITSDSDSYNVFSTIVRVPSDSLTPWSQQTVYSSGWLLDNFATDGRRLFITRNDSVAEVGVDQLVQWQNPVQVPNATILSDLALGSRCLYASVNLDATLPLYGINLTTAKITVTPFFDGILSVFQRQGRVFVFTFLGELFEMDDGVPADGDCGTPRTWNFSGGNLKDIWVDPVDQQVYVLSYPCDTSSETCPLTIYRLGTTAGELMVPETIGTISGSPWGYSFAVVGGQVYWSDSMNVMVGLGTDRRIIGQGDAVSWAVDDKRIYWEVSCGIKAIARDDEAR